jgi:hypothetical protein
MEDAMVWSNVGHVRKARLRVLDLRDIQAPKTTLIDLPVGGRFYSGIVASGDELLLGYYEAGLLGQGRARFFAQPLLLSDLDEPRHGREHPGRAAPLQRGRGPHRDQPADARQRRGPDAGSL